MRSTICGENRWPPWYQKYQLAQKYPHEYKRRQASILPMYGSMVSASGIVQLVALLIERLS